MQGNVNRTLKYRNGASHIRQAKSPPNSQVFSANLHRKTQTLPSQIMLVCFDPQQKQTALSDIRTCWVVRFLVRFVSVKADRPCCLSHDHVIASCDCVMPAQPGPAQVGVPARLGGSGLARGDLAQVGVLAWMTMTTLQT